MFREKAQGKKGIQTPDFPRNPHNNPAHHGSSTQRGTSQQRGSAMTMPSTQPATIINLALRSFGQARSALRRGRVDEMIGELTRGAELLELIGRSVKPARRRPARKATS
jgi:hypothetical protein